MPNMKIAPILLAALFMVIVSGCGGDTQLTPLAPPSLQSASFSWNPVTSDINNQPLSVNGYLLHCGPSDGDLLYTWDMGNVTSYSVTQFPPGVYCCAISAYVMVGSAQVEGACSNTMCP